MKSLQARLCIQMPGEASLLCWLDGPGPWTLGRDAQCEVRIVHDSVSRRHAEISAQPAWKIRDLGSKNGIRVDGATRDEAELGRRQWIALGDVFCEFQLIEPEAAEQLREHDVRRRHASAAWQERVGAAGAIDAVLEQTLLGMVEIAECRRGFLLVGDGSTTLVPRLSFGLDASDLDGAEFSGSRSAVARCMRERRPVFLGDSRDRPALKGAPSVVARGLRALACVPLERPERLLGVAYVDTDDESKVFTQLDVELLRAFADRAATALALADLEGELRAIEEQHGNRNDTMHEAPP